MYYEYDIVLLEDIGVFTYNIYNVVLSWWIWPFYFFFHFIIL